MNTRAIALGNCPGDCADPATTTRRRPVAYALASLMRGDFAVPGNGSVPVRRTFVPTPARPTTLAEENS